MRFSIVLVALLTLFGLPLILVLLGESQAAPARVRYVPERRAAPRRNIRPKRLEALPSPSPTAPDPTPLESLPPFASSEETAGIVVHSDDPLPLDALRRLGLENLALFRAWLGEELPLETVDSYEIYICSSSATLRRLAEQHGISVEPPAGHEYDFRGGFLDQKDMVLIEAEAYGGLDRNLAHELAHAAWSEANISDNCALAEGFAENAVGLARELPPTRYTGPGLSEALHENNVGSLETFLALSYWDFHESSKTHLHYAMAYAFVNLLLESSDPAIEGRFLEYLGEVRRVGNAWEALCRTYEDVAGLERAWNARMHGLANWELVYGEWNLGDDWQHGSVETGSAIALHKAPLEGARPYTLTTRIDRVPPQAFGVGFVVGYEDRQNYLLVILRPDLPRVTVTARENGLWQGTELYSLGSKRLTPQKKLLRLEVDSEGRMRLWLEAQELASHDLGLRALHGRTGLFLEHVSGPRTSVLFKETERSP